MSRRAVLFDLDGTLADTAPDLVAVLTVMLREQGHPPMPYAVARNEVSNGSSGLVRLGFGGELPPVELETLRQRFLELYTAAVCIHSRLFPHLRETCEGLSRSGTPWGVVTNKPQIMTVPLLDALGLGALARAIVSGDQLPQRKPHPAPLLLAAAELEVEPARCIYVGDAPRDIEAGHAAGMSTVAAAYGYIRPQENVLAWGADHVARSPRELARLLETWTAA
jgi:phosphoglycolate phosphatase